MPLHIKWCPLPMHVVKVFLSLNFFPTLRLRQKTFIFGFNFKCFIHYNGATRKMLVSIVGFIWLISVFNRKFAENICAAGLVEQQFFFFSERDNILMEFIKYFRIFGLSPLDTRVYLTLNLFSVPYLAFAKWRQKKIMFPFETIEGTATSILKGPSTFTSNKQISDVILNIAIQQYLPERLFYTFSFIIKAVSSYQK